MMERRYVPMKITTYRTWMHYHKLKKLTGKKLLALVIAVLAKNELKKISNSDNDNPDLLCLK